MLAIVSAAPIPDLGITEAQLLQIAPASASCDGATPECRTAAQAAPLLNLAHANYEIATKGEIAALVSLQVFESGQFRFNTNQCVFSILTGYPQSELMRILSQSW